MNKLGKIHHKIKKMYHKNKRQIHGIGIGAIVVTVLNVLLVGTLQIMNTFAAVTTTPATGGTNISQNTASNGSSPAYTALSGIVITE